jgi:hypothetical protein
LGQRLATPMQIEYRKTKRSVKWGELLSSLKSIFD